MADKLNYVSNFFVLGKNEIKIKYYFIFQKDTEKVFSVLPKIA